MSRQAGPPEDYVDVASRIAEFREKYPDGALQPADIEHPFRMVEAGGKTFIVVVAAAYRGPDDTRPGIGQAWEPFPGPTPFTRDSELQNAETSAWGRAIIAALAADSKRGVASAEEVRNRRATPEPAPKPEPVDLTELDELIVEATEKGVRGDYDALRDYARQGRQFLAAAVEKLQKQIADASEHPADEGELPF